MQKIPNINIPTIREHNWKIFKERFKKFKHFSDIINQNKKKYERESNKKKQSKKTKEEKEIIIKRDLQKILREV